MPNKNVTVLYYVEIYRNNGDENYILQSCYFRTPSEAEVKFVEKIDFLHDDYHIAIMSVDYIMHSDGEVEYGDINTYKVIK